MINENTCFIGFLGGQYKETSIQAIIISNMLQLESFSEKSIFMSIYKCFKSKHTCKDIIIDEADFPFLINNLRKTGYEFFLLDENGEDYCKHSRKILSGRNIFIMGAHEDIPSESFEVFKRYSIKISIGPVSLHTSHVIAYLSTIIRRLTGQITPCPMF